MPPIRSARNRKAPPDGFDDIEDTLLEFSNKMKDAENASHEGKKRHEVLWPIFQITHQRTLVRYLLRSFPSPFYPSPASSALGEAEPSLGFSLRTLSLLTPTSSKLSDILVFFSFILTSEISRRFTIHI